MIHNKIEIKDYGIQSKIFLILMVTLLSLWILISFMFVFNRVTYGKKYIDIKYFHSNLTNNTIKSIVPAGDIVDGDNYIIENYLAEYVKIRETIIPGDHQTKDKYIRAFTSPEILSIYFERAEKQRRVNPNYFSNINVTKVVKLDDTLFQVHYYTFIKPSYKQQRQFKKEMIATLRYRLADLPEYDMRLKIKNFGLINPLKIELAVYTTALRLS
jgi:type IV secretory pathway component VirB8